MQLPSDEYFAPKRHRPVITQGAGFHTVICPAHSSCDTSLTSQGKQKQPEPSLWTPAFLQTLDLVNW